MFGKGRRMSGTDKFVMAQGRKVGNVAKIMPGVPAGTGKSEAGKSFKSVAKPGLKLNAQKKTTLSVNSKRGKSANQNLPPSLGKVNTFKT